jgi:hypothetical protein
MGWERAVSRASLKGEETPGVFLMEQVFQYLALCQLAMCSVTWR